MARLLFSTGLLLIGLLAGWWLRDLMYELPTAAVPVPEGQQPGPLPVDAAGQTAGISRETVEQSPDTSTFNALLQRREYEQAIDYYDLALRQDDQFHAVLKPGLERYLGARVRDCADRDFIDLVDTWLGAYYADIQVLLLLAEHQRYCSSSEEAVQTLQLAKTYALNPGDLESVDMALGRLVAATDQRLSQQQEWIALLGFYEFMAALDLDTQESQLRQALLYGQVGEVERSQALLRELRENDDYQDPEWTAALERQLQDRDAPPVVASTSMYEISLTRRGTHYLVPAVVNDEATVDLIIDTGASITTLSRDSFDRLDKGGVRYLGTRLFNTANGVTEGRLYRADSIRLGDASMRDIDIAVLDLESSPGLNGLLGMNVLRNYRFEIDQDRDLLLMSPRG